MAAVALALSADDGAVALSGRYHAPCGAVKGAVLIAGAMGVKQDYYAEFAQWLAAQGYAALSFDYRGMGESLPAGRSLRGFKADMFDWARDIDAAIDGLLARHPDAPLYVVGLVSVAAGSGYWRDNAPRLKRIVLYFWHVLVPLGVAIAGYFPGKRIGKVGDLPRGVVLQWRRWCMHPRYHVGAEGEAVRARFAAATFPIVALSITDDELMTERGTRALIDCYENAPRQLQRIAPSDVGVPRIGHFGFFRRQFEPTLWRRLEQQLAGFG
jgi:predicted alpha/beta hydrolase